MLQPRTLKFLAAFVVIYFLLLIPGFFWPQYLDSPVGLIAAIPMLSVYLFHTIGIPFLLENNGACGWGWCAPTLFGWVFTGVFWLGALWLFAALTARLTRR
jgi:hypothetical protein